MGTGREDGFTLLTRLRISGSALSTTIKAEAFELHMPATDVSDIRVVLSWCLWCPIFLQGRSFQVGELREKPRDKQLNKSDDEVLVDIGILENVEDSLDIIHHHP